LIESALAGAGLLIAARIVIFNVEKYGSPQIRLTWEAFAPHLDFAGTGVATLALGILTPFLGNMIVPSDKARERSIRKHGNNLLRTLYAATTAEKLVSLTLDNRKTYVAYVLDAPNLDPQDSFVMLAPLLSGYRDKDTLELKFTTRYSNLYTDEVDPADFSVTVPIARVTTVSFFQEQLYERFSIETTEAVRSPANASVDAVIPHAG
jgi:hypothetical protein